MVVLPSAFYQHVVIVDLDIPSYLMCEHLIHEPLICHAYVLEAKRHHFVVEEALVGNERSFLLICFVHSNLVIS